MMARILAIDYGQKRTGLAVTDEMQIIASGLTTVASETVIDFLKDYCWLQLNKIQQVTVSFLCASAITNVLFLEDVALLIDFRSLQFY